MLQRTAVKAVRCAGARGLQKKGRLGTFGDSGEKAVKLARFDVDVDVDAVDRVGDDALLRLPHNKRSLPERQNANRDTEHRQRDHPHDDQLSQKRNVLHAFHCSSADWSFFQYTTLLRRHRHCFFLYRVFCSAKGRFCVYRASCEP